MESSHKSQLNRNHKIKELVGKLNQKDLSDADDLCQTSNILKAFVLHIADYVIQKTDKIDNLSQKLIILSHIIDKYSKNEQTPENLSNLQTALEVFFAFSKITSNQKEAIIYKTQNILTPIIVAINADKQLNQSDLYKQNLYLRSIVLISYHELDIEITNTFSQTGLNVLSDGERSILNNQNNFCGINLIQSNIEQINTEVSCKLFELSGNLQITNKTKQNANQPNIVINKEFIQQSVKKTDFQSFNK